MSNILTKNGINLSWNLAYYGLINKWISPVQVVEAISNGSFEEDVEIDIMVELEISKEDEREFVNFVRQLSSTVDQERVVEVWELAFLLEILKSSNAASRKLEEFENLWARFNYPDKWSRFIYYLPNDDGTASAEELFKRLLDYSDNEKVRLGLKK